MKAFPELSPVVLVVDEAAVVRGWVHPRTAEGMLHEFRRAMEGMRAGAGGDPFPVACPLPVGWSAEEGMSLEAGHSKVRFPPGILPTGDPEDDDYAFGGCWDVVLVGELLGLRWHINVTPQGDVAARPFPLSDLLTPADYFENGKAVFDWPRPGPASVALPGLRDPLAMIPEDVRASRGLAVARTDGVSWGGEYRGPFWDYAGSGITK